MTEVLRSNDGTSNLLSPRSNDNDDSATAERREKNNGEVNGLSLIALLLAVVRKSVLGCKTEEVADSGGGGGGEEEAEEVVVLRRRSMEIGCPTNVRHVAHVTFDRFHGFLGLPVEFEPEVPRRAPSASATVFGVSTESMQCSYDTRGNSVPTILLLMQERLYALGGLRVEGIFRITGENSEEEFVRDQLNNGIVPDGIDVHCLAGLIKAWFRELPTGLLDTLSPEQVMQCQSEEECAQLVKQLPSSESALLDWAVNLMADVVQEEQQNKMNARNVAMVFAPNMTQMADPLTALMYAVQVMNFLKMLIEKALRDRQEPMLEAVQIPHPDSSNGHESPQLQLDVRGEQDAEQVDTTTEEPVLDAPAHIPDEDSPSQASNGSQNAHQSSTSETAQNSMTSMTINEPENLAADALKRVKQNSRRSKRGQSSNNKKGQRKGNGQSVNQSTVPADKTAGTSIVSRINSKVERIEAWR